MTPGPVLDAWFAGDRDTFQPRWFKRDDGFDAVLRERFADWLGPAREGALDGWAATPQGALALLLLLDQVPRNLHRGTPAAFAGDAKARAVARQAVLVSGLDAALPPTERVFLYLPFEHSEAPADQDLSVALFEGLRDAPGLGLPGAAIDYAWRHRAVIRRFGRFPHRNAALGRRSTVAELDYLAQPGAGF